MNMKKSFFVFFVCLGLFSMVTIASAANDFHLGFQQGYNHSRTIISENISPMANLGIDRAQGGLFLTRPLGGNFWWQAGLNFTQKGSLFRMPLYEERWHLNYLEAAFMLRFYPLGMNIPLIPSVFVGGYTAERLGVKHTVNGEELAGDTLLTKGIRSFDWGVIGGISLAVKSGSGLLYVEGRYLHGLGNVLKKPELFDLQPKTTAHNRTVAVLFGYSLPLKRSAK
jgi:hypothetical protein